MIDDSRPVSTQKKGISGEIVVAVSARVKRHNGRPARTDFPKCISLNKISLQTSIYLLVYSHGVYNHVAFEKGEIREISYRSDFTG